MFFDQLHNPSTSYIMKVISFLCIVLFLTSCVPLSIAPDLSEGKIIRGKKFRKKLPNRNTYAFTDPKDADEFYYFINTKYQLDHNEVTNNVPLEIDNKKYYMSFYETGKSTQTFNLIPILIDAKREQNDNSPLFEEVHTSRRDTYYILVMITDEDFKDALQPNYESYPNIYSYVSALKDEYLSTCNYNQTILAKAKN